MRQSRDPDDLLMGARVRGNERQGHHQIVLDGCFNFRDIGGYSTGNGKQVRRNRLYRSDGLQRLTERDRVRFVSLGIMTVLDLRATTEVEQGGRFDAESVATRWHHVPLYDVPPIEVIDRFFDVDPAVAAGDSYMPDVYEAMLDDGLDGVATALALLAEPEALPGLFHCSGGKDRTGILAAVVLRLLGVSIDDIADDYALSQPAMDEIFAWISANLAEGPEILRRCTPVALRAERATMLRFLERVEDRHGSMEALVSTAGVPDDTVRRLRNTLLETSNPLAVR